MAAASGWFLPSRFFLFVSIGRSISDIWTLVHSSESKMRGWYTNLAAGVSYVLKFSKCTFTPPNLLIGSCQVQTIFVHAKLPRWRSDWNMDCPFSLHRLVLAMAPAFRPLLPFSRHPPAPSGPFPSHRGGDSSVGPHRSRLGIAAAWGMRLLVKLLSHTDPMLLEHGVTTLLNLSTGAIRQLVHALKYVASPAARVPRL